MRLIDADALEKSLTEKGDDYKVSMFATSDDCNIARVVAFECAEEVKNAPTIEAEPVRHGMRTNRTIWHTSGWGEIYTSYSCCGFQEKGKTNHNYCPNCGAKMDLK